MKANLYKISYPHLRGEILRDDRKDEFTKVATSKKPKHPGKTKMKAK